MVVESYFHEIFYYYNNEKYSNNCERTALNDISAGSIKVLTQILKSLTIKSSTSPASTARDNVAKCQKKSNKKKKKIKIKKINELL